MNVIYLKMYIRIHNLKITLFNNNIVQKILMTVFHLYIKFVIMSYSYPKFICNHRYCFKYNPFNCIYAHIPYITTGYIKMF